MKDMYEIAGGSIVGRNHRIAGRNNQDAYGWIMDDNRIIALVCDGCGSGESSEVGARLGCRLLLREISRQAERFGADEYLQLGSAPPVRFWEAVEENVLARIRIMADGMGDSLPRTVNDYWLFTAVGAFATGSGMMIFSIGDGVACVDSRVDILGPDDNMPPYLGYNLLGSPGGRKNRFRIDHVCRVDEWNSLLIGTDGIVDLMRAEGRMLPGKKESVGPVAAFWANDEYFHNADQARRRLYLVNRDFTAVERDQAGRVTGIRKENGLLPDDTTLVVIRRRREV